MTPRVWCVCLAAACAATACSFDLADVVTDAPDDGGTPDVAPGDDAAGADAGDEGTTTSDARPSGDGGGSDAPADAKVDTAQPDTGGEAGPTRVTNGIVLLYTFKEGSGTVVHDVSGVAPAYDLTIQTPASTTWVATGLRIDTAGPILGNGAGATKVRAALAASNEITMEAWTTPGAASSGSQFGRVMELSRTNQPDFDMAQVGTKWMGSLHVPGGVMTIDAATTVSLTRTHYVVTRNAAGAWVTYINGAQTATGTIAGQLGAAWDNSSQYTIGNSHVGDDPYVGLLSLVAVYQRALSQQEVVQNYNVGP
jgi:hypothetical protein